MTDDSKTITLTIEQFDASLKKQKRKGAERALAFAFWSSIPLALVGGALSESVSSVQILGGCVVYYCIVAAIASRVR